MRVAGQQIHASSAAPPRPRADWGAAWREARDLIAAHRRRLALGLALMLVGRLAALVLPWTSKVLIDEVIHRGRADLLPWLAALAALAVTVEVATAFALTQLLGVAAQRAINDLRRAVHAHVVRLPVRYFDGTPSGQVISRVMTDAEGIRNLVGNGLVRLVGGLVTAFGAGALLLWLNWRLTLAIVAVLTAFGVGMAKAFNRLRPLFRERGRINAEVTGRLGEGLDAIRVVKAYVAEAREGAVFAGGIDRLFANVRRTITGVSLTDAAATVAVGAVGILMLVVGGRSVLAQQMTLGDFVWFGILAGLVSAPVSQVAAVGTQISEAFAGLDRIRELRRMTTEDAADAGKLACPPLRGELAVDAVTFGYDPQRPVLHAVSFTAAAGTTVALVGPSGSGKSTIANLVLGFIAPQAGTVRVDGLDLAELRLAGYRAQIAVVLQDNVLFDGTVAENIAYARPDADEDEVLAAARAAHCDDFVQGLADGYRTVVGERGVKLSGGQRQRVAIARAILARPRILILDEATSSLDSESEARIQDALRTLRRGRTTLVIAHRLSTIRAADQILVLDGGRIVERGSHDQLLARDGLYRRLHDRQQGVEQERFVNPGEEMPVA